MSEVRCGRLKRSRPGWFQKTLVLWLLLLGGGLAGAWHPAEAESRYQSAMVVDAQNASVLYERDGGALWYPASLTKMMTVYLTFEAMAQGALRPSDVLLASPYAAAQRGTVIGLKPGDKISVDFAIRSLIVRSANDVAVVLAERLGGGESAFAGAMTDAARNLGMFHTVYRNATGLPNGEQVTTARDMAILARALLTRFAEYYPYFSGRSVHYQGRELPTYNGLLLSYAGADGFKTGFTCAAGYNIVASAQRAGRRLIGVLLGSLSRGERASTISQLLNQGFAMAAAGGRPNLYELFKDTAITLLKRPQPVAADGCNSSPGPGPEEDGPKLVPHPHQGWSVAIGTFPAVDQPSAVLAQLKARWPGDIAGGKYRVVTHQGEVAARRSMRMAGLKEDQAKVLSRLVSPGAGEAAGYSLVIVGLNRDQVGALCSRQAWPARAACMPITPSSSDRPAPTLGKPARIASMLLP